MEIHYGKVPLAVLSTTSLDSLDVKELYSIIDKHSFVCLKGLYTKTEINNSVERLKYLFQSSKDICTVIAKAFMKCP